MAVLLSNVQLTVRRRTHGYPRDEWGQPVPTALGPATGPYRSAVKEQPRLEGSATPSEWTVRLPTQAWPLEAGDELYEVGSTRKWVVIGQARLHQVPGVPDVDYVQASATLAPPEVP